MTGSEATLMAASGTLLGIVLREVPRIVMEKIFLRKQPESSNGNGKRLELRADMKEIFVDILARDIAPIMNRQTEILGQIATTNESMAQHIAILVDRGERH